MALLVDLFGYLGVVVHGLVIAAQSVALGSVFFLLFLARPLAGDLGIEGREIAGRVARVAAWSAVALAAVAALNLGLETAVLLATTELSPLGALGAGFALVGIAKVALSAALRRSCSGGARSRPERRSWRSPGPCSWLPR